MRASGYDKPIWICLSLLALAALCIPLLVACCGSEDLLLTAIHDDGFYFLTIARNIAQGRGPTFDGLGPTNGFHPLWAYTLVPIFLWNLPTDYAAARLAIILATLLHVAAAAAVGRAAELLTDRRCGRLAAFSYLVNPLALYLVVSGMESALLGLLIAMLTAEMIRLRQGRASLSEGKTVLRVGLLCGLCMLARTDTVLLVGLILTGALVSPLGRSAPDLALRLRGSLLTGLVALIVIAPWLGWNLWRFGSLVQVSAQAHHLHSVSRAAGGESGGLLAAFSVAGRLMDHLLQSLQARTGVPLAGWVIVVVVAVVLFLWWLSLMFGPRPVRRDFIARLRQVDASLLYAVGFLAATFFVLGHIRSWYIAGPLAVGAVLLALPAYYALGSSPLRAAGRVISALIFLGLCAGVLPLGPMFAREKISYAQSVHHWRSAAQWVEQNTRPEERVASFNSGSFGYLCSRTVINLDCVVNNRALPYLRQKQLLAFLHDERIRYVIDNVSYVEKFMRWYGEPGAQAALVPVDTLAYNLVAYEVR